MYIEANERIGKKCKKKYRFAKRGIPWIQIQKKWIARIKIKTQERAILKNSWRTEIQSYLKEGHREGDKQYTHGINRRGKIIKSFIKINKQTTVLFKFIYIYK